MRSTSSILRRQERVGLVVVVLRVQHPVAVDKRTGDLASKKRVGSELTDELSMMWAR